MARIDPHDLGAQVYKAISGRSINTEPDSFTDALSYFTRLAGGNISGAARLAGVPRRTFRDWLDGKGAGPRSAARREDVARSAKLSARRERLRPGREARIRAAAQDGVFDISMTGGYAYDGTTDARAPIMISEYMDEGAGEALVDAYLDGAGPDELRTLFADLIVDAPFYAETMKLPPGDTHGWWVSDLTIST